jgi:polar amino acid transport system permease protein
MFRSFTINEVLFLLEATQWTIAITLIAFVGGGIVGLLIMFLKVANSRIANWTAIVYVELFQGTPLLAQLFIVYFGFGLFGYDVSPWIGVAAAFTLWSAAFLGEIWRGCVEAIPRAQWEASASLGLNFLEQLRYVIAPQATRIAVPPTVGFLVQIIKNTSLASVIGFIELTRAGQIVNAATFRPFLIYCTIALIYFALCYPLTTLSRRLEGKLHVAY